MKKSLPIIIIMVVLAVLIWFIFKKVLPNLNEAKKKKESNKKESGLTNYEADATIKFIHNLPI
jgi:F0F1-type ATP synthase membrane subunit b/b'